MRDHSSSGTAGVRLGSEPPPQGPLSSPLPCSPESLAEGEKGGACGLSAWGQVLANTYGVKNLRPSARGRTDSMGKVNRW